jgi:heptosyltransferase-1
MIRAKHPDAEISWWISDDLSPLLDGDPDIPNLIEFHRKKWASPRYWGDIARSIAAARRLRFDWVLDLQGLARSAAYSWFVNGGFTVGLDNPREGASLAYDVAVGRPSESSHAVDWYLEVLTALDVPVQWDFEWLPRRPLAEVAVERGLDGWSGPLITICPGARWNTKRWPVERFERLIDRIEEAVPETRIAVIGGRGDREMGEALIRGNPERRLDLTGRTSLAEMIEWIRRSAMLITNDTGPMHVGAALKTPVVGLFGPTDPRQTGPYGQLNETLQVGTLPCVPCRKSACRRPVSMECLVELTPEFVFERVMERWRGLERAP